MTDLMMFFVKTGWAWGILILFCIFGRKLEDF